MQKLTLFKVENDTLSFVGYFDTQEEVTHYLTQIKGMIDKSFQHQYCGDYLLLPTIHYNLERQ